MRPGRINFVTCKVAALAARCALVLALGALAVSAPPALAADQEGCLTCHQYRGLARLKDDGASISLYYVSPSYYSQALGPHARLKCTDCHVRTEVEVYPHNMPTPVDCSRTCHLSSPGQVERVFSHERVGQMLAGSVHKPEAMAKANSLLDESLRAGQSSCLLCHDEPRFSRSVTLPARGELPTERCGTCHDEQLPVDTAHMFSHVMARSLPARTNQDMVRVCALCHANEKVRKEFKLPNSVVSYLSSFHGKANLLGSQETANCLDCHVSAMQNVHVMLAKNDARSSTALPNLPDTCRSSACHASAGNMLTTAAMHLDLPTSRGVEYVVAAVFVILIVFTFGPSLLITLLKLVHLIFSRQDPDDPHYHHVAVKLLEVPGARRKLVRFDVHQRVQHWFLAVTFILLVLTGFPIKFADRAWAQWVIGSVFSSLPTARLVHRVCGVLLIVGFFYHLGYVFRTLWVKLRAENKGLIRTVMALPMTVTPTDALQMQALLLYLVGIRKHRPQGGRFNPEEKFEYIGVFWGTFVLGVTGLLMWFNAWTTRYLPGRILTIATLIHTFEAFLALLHVGIVHMVSVIFSPGVFPVSPAMFTGRTPTEELVEGHAGMLSDLEKELPPHGAAAGAGTGGHHG